MRVHRSEGVAIRTGPRAMRRRPERAWRSVGRGMHRPAIEPRNPIVLGADAVQEAEGNTVRRAIASARPARRGRRPWHVQKFLAREPRDLVADRLRVTAAARVGKVRSRSRR